MNTIINGIDYGPLAQLVGKWVGVRGFDKAPEPNGIERTPFIDELTFKPAGPASNAEEQDLVAVHYHHVVRKTENGRIFHDQIGHWLYEAETSLVMHSLTIPRGVCLLAGGSVVEKDEEITFDVKAEAGSDTFGIMQSPFMLKKAKTKAFHMNLSVKGNEMNYKETTFLHIYGRDFDHIDRSTLQKVTYEQD